MAENNFYSGFTVVLESDIDEETMKRTLETLNMIKGVIDVKPVEREKIEIRINKSRIKKEFMDAINNAIKDI